MSERKYEERRTKRKSEIKNLKNRNGIWHVIFTYQGVKFDKTTGTKEITEAIKFRDKYINSIKNGKFLNNNDINKVIKKEISFEDLAIEYLNYKENKISNKTKDLYDLLIRNLFEYFILYKIKDINASVLYDYIKFRRIQGSKRKTSVIVNKNENKTKKDTRKIVKIKTEKYDNESNSISDGYIMKELKVLRCLIDFAIKNDYINNNIFNTFKINEELKDYGIREQYLTAEEIEKILNNSNIYLKRLIIFLLETGMRINETLQLKFEDISSNSDYLSPKSETTKSNKSRAIPLSKLSKEQIELQRKDFPNSEYIFTDKNGNKYKTTPKTSLKTACNKAAIGYTGFHIFRHTFASLRLQGISPITGEKIKRLEPIIIQNILGHKDLSTTLRIYAKFCSQSIVDIFNESYKN